MLKQENLALAASQFSIAAPPNVEDLWEQGYVADSISEEVVQALCEERYKLKYRTIA